MVAKTTAKKGHNGIGRNPIKEAIYHILVTIGALIMIYPLLWMVLSSFKPTNTVLATSAQLIPTEWTLDNYVQGWKGFMGYTFATFFANSFFISLTSTFGTLVSSACVAYALKRLKFKLRGILFVLVLSTMMLPAQILMIPQFMWFRHLNWVGTYYPMILPYFFAIQGFFVYLCMNFIGGIPSSLDEAAKIDGCSYYGIFFRIILPLMKPSFASMGIFVGMNSWNSFLWPMLVIRSNDKITLPIGLASLITPYGNNYDVLLAGSIFAIIPIIILFILFQKYFISGMTAGGVKG